MANDHLKEKPPDELNDLLRAWDGHQPVITLDRDQAIRAAYIVASKRPCYLCGQPPFVVGKKMLRELGKVFIYGLCPDCFLMDERERDNIIEELLMDDLESLQHGTSH